MIKTYNYTGRKKLPQNTIRIRIEGDMFTAEWSLDEYGMPDDAAVYVEAFKAGATDVIRFPYGTLGTPDPEASGRKLDGLVGEGLGFNFKVVDENEKIGRLLGLVENIKPVGEEDDEAGQQSILPVNPTDLGDQLWKLSFQNNRPWLDVNNRVPDIMQIVKEDRQFFSLVYPAVVREILIRVLIIEDYNDPDGSPDDWRVQWLKWGIHWHPDQERPAEGDLKSVYEDWLIWVDQVVNAFCQKHSVRDKYIFPNGEESQS